MDKRTNSQNRALHLFFAKLANTLNTNGLFLNKVLNNKQNKKIDIAITYGIKKYPTLKSFFEDMRSYLKEEVKDIVWTPSTVKELIWKPFQEAIFGTKSTQELNRAEVDIVYGAIAKKMATDFGIDVGDFPNSKIDMS